MTKQEKEIILNQFKETQKDYRFALESKAFFEKNQDAKYLEIAKENEHRSLCFLTAIVNLCDKLGIDPYIEARKEDI